MKKNIITKNLYLECGLMDELNTIIVNKSQEAKLPVSDEIRQCSVVTCSKFGKIKKGYAVKIIIGDPFDTEVSSKTMKKFRQLCDKFMRTESSDGINGTFFYIISFDKLLKILGKKFKNYKFVKFTVIRNSYNEEVDYILTIIYEEKAKKRSKKKDLEAVVDDDDVEDEFDDEDVSYDDPTIIELEKKVNDLTNSIKIKSEYFLDDMDKTNISSEKIEEFRLRVEEYIDDMIGELSIQMSEFCNGLDVNMDEDEAEKQIYETLENKVLRLLEIVTVEFEKKNPLGFVFKDIKAEESKVDEESETVYSDEEEHETELSKIIKQKYDTTKSDSAQ